MPSDDYLPAIARVIGVPLEEVRQAAWYTKRAKASSMPEALALLTQLQTEVLRLRSEVDELRQLIQQPKSEGRGKRQR